MKSLPNNLQSASEVSTAYSILEELFTAIEADNFESAYAQMLDTLNLIKAIPDQETFHSHLKDLPLLGDDELSDLVISYLGNGDIADVPVKLRKYIAKSVNFSFPEDAVSTGTVEPEAVAASVAVAPDVTSPVVADNPVVPPVSLEPTVEPVVPPGVEQSAIAAQAANAEPVATPASEPEKPVIMVKYCSVCGAEVRPSDKFCHNCGCDLSACPPSDTPPPPPAPPAPVIIDRKNVLLDECCGNCGVDVEAYLLRAPGDKISIVRGIINKYCADCPSDFTCRQCVEMLSEETRAALIQELSAAISPPVPVVTESSITTNFSSDDEKLIEEAIELRVSLKKDGADEAKSARLSEISTILKDRGFPVNFCKVTNFSGDGTSEKPATTPDNPESKPADTENEAAALAAATEAAKAAEAELEARKLAEQAQATADAAAAQAAKAEADKLAAEAEASRLSGNGSSSESSGKDDDEDDNEEDEDDEDDDQEIIKNFSGLGVGEGRQSADSYDTFVQKMQRRFTR